MWKTGGILPVGVAGVDSGLAVAEGLGIVGVLVLLVISLVTGRNFIGAYLGGGSSSPTQTQRVSTGRAAGDAGPGRGPGCAAGELCAG